MLAYSRCLLVKQAPADNAEFSKLKKDNNSVKIHVRVMGLGQ
jgi:hypothetical protein